jgi:hypothetical protein|tara:strand:+ start:68 stop:193 length:126 start_codon:yes stop_codon:yes gene_type:complete
MIEHIREQILKEKLKDRPDSKLIQKLQQLFDAATKNSSKKI